MRFFPMYKSLLVLTFLFALALGAAAVSTSTRADNPARKTQGRSYRVVFGTRPSISQLEVSLLLPIDPFGNSILSPVFRRGEEGEGTEGDLSSSSSLESLSDSAVSED